MLANERTKPAKLRNGNPESAKPMPGLSARAQKLLAPSSAHYRFAIEPKGDAELRAAMKKAAI